MVAVLIAFLLIGVLFTFLLYVAIEAETDNTEILDRRTAEEEAKRRGGVDPQTQFGRGKDRDPDRADARERDDDW